MNSAASKIPLQLLVEANLKRVNTNSKVKISKALLLNFGEMVSVSDD
jgi:hypothetical protein